MADGFTVTNKHIPETYEKVTVTKEWNDKNNQDGIRPDEIEVRLLKNGEDFKTLKLKKSENWTITVENLPKYDNGNLIKYSVEESRIDGYNSPETAGDVATGFVITNSRDTAVVKEFAIEKVWKDGNNIDQIRPGKISVTLIGEVDGTAVVRKEVTLDKEHDYKAKVTDLQENYAGKKISYKLVEETIPGYREGVVTGNTDAGFKVTNARSPQSSDKLTITKNWIDGNNQDRIRPTSIEVILKQNGKKFGETLKLSEKNEWSVTVDAPKVDEDGVEYNYTVEEPDVPNGYTSKVEGFVITNTHKPAETEVTVKKIWDDKEDAFSNRPEEISVQLYRDTGDEISPVGDLTKLSEENNWKATFSNLAKFDNGKEITYTVEEVNVPDGYSSSVNDTVVTNTLKSSGSITINKKWIDKNDMKGKRPDSIDVNIIAGNRVIKTVTLTANENWTKTVEGLPEYVEGQKAEYTVEEAVVPEGYDSKVEGTTIVNSIKSTNPETGDEEESGDSSNGHSPKTGDDNNIMGWLTLLMVSALGAAGGIAHNRKRIRK